MENPFSHLEDTKLMELYKNGENMAFEVIYLRHKDRVYSYLDKRLSDKNVIEDIFQNIFVKFHNSRHLYSSEHPLLKWIYTICRSELLDSVKKSRKIKLVSINEDQLICETKEIDDKIDLDSVKSLSEKEKLAIKLRYYSEEDFTDISKALKTSEANSRKLVSRGIKKLKAKLIGEAK
jgi:RNA polymerase sigma-70 factor (ECF subfamily)|tara:strand:- start:47 stop:580 length:534 start_codon:yes stop_codon:yes gene_type:complete